MSGIAENWAAVQRRAAEAAERVGRRPADVTVLAASKTFGPDVLREAYEAGVRQFGENYVQEALDKLPELPKDVCWHLIGHLQSNKARHVVGRFGLIHSVDSVHLAEAIERQAAKHGIRQAVLVQVNIADEETKSGLAPEEVLDAAGEIARLDHLEVRGLMTIGPMVTNAEDARPVFAQLRELRDRAQSRLPHLPLRELSMG